jgi:predicted transcriptional regulator
MKRTTVKIPDDLDLRLRHEAERKGITVSEVVRTAIEAHLSVDRRGRLEATAGRRLAGGRTFDSGRSDISERIEEILRDEWTDPHS